MFVAISFSHALQYSRDMSLHVQYMYMCCNKHQKHTTPNLFPSTNLFSHIVGLFHNTHQQLCLNNLCIVFSDSTISCCQTVAICKSALEQKPLKSLSALCVMWSSQSLLGPVFLSQPSCTALHCRLKPSSLVGVARHCDVSPVQPWHIIIASLLLSGHMIWPQRCLCLMNNRNIM